MAGKPLPQTERASFEATLTNNLMTDMPPNIKGGRTAVCLGVSLRKG
jgi:hypothetical protein